MTTTVTVFAHCNKGTEVQVTVSDPSFNFNPELTILQNGESTEKHVFDDRSITIREVILKKMGDVQDSESTVERDLSDVQVSDELASSNIKRDNSLLFAEKFLEFNENIVVHDEAVNTLQIELEEMANAIIAVNHKV